MKKAYRVDRLIMAYPCHPKVFILFNIYKKQYVIFLKCVIHLLIFFSHFHSKMRMYVGVFAFRKEVLLNFTSWPMSPLEAAEKIECLRYLENGVPLRMVVVDYMGVEIDTPEDLERANRLL